MSAKLSGDFWKEDCTIAGRSYSPTLNPVHLLTSPFDPACLCSCCRCSKYFAYLAPHRMGWRWRHKSAGKLPQILANGKFSRPEIPLRCDFWGELPSPEYSLHPKFACWVLIPKGRLCKQCKDKSRPRLSLPQTSGLFLRKGKWRKPVIFYILSVPIWPPQWICLQTINVSNLSSLLLVGLSVSPLPCHF